MHDYLESLPWISIARQLGILIAVGFLFSLFLFRYGAHVYRWRRQKWERRLEARLERGTDFYFEEMRSIRENEPTAPSVPASWRFHFANLWLLLGYLVAWLSAARIFDTWLTDAMGW
jgi:hypothetical protein